MERKKVLNAISIYELLLIILMCFEAVRPFGLERTISTRLGTRVITNDIKVDHQPCICLFDLAIL